MPTITRPGCPDAMITVTLPDGSSRQVADGAPVAAVAADISPRLAQAALAAVVDDQLVDLTLSARPATRASASSPTRAPKRWPLTRHSTAHLMAAAVTALYPGAQCGIGPAIDEGYFYDFVVPQPFVPEDLERIEAKMRELAAQDLVFERQMWDRAGGDRLLRAARRAAQGAADRGEDGRPGRRSRSTPSRTATRSSTSASARTCRRRHA